MAQNFMYAGFWRRALALLLDTIILIIFIAVFDELIEIIFDLPDHAEEMTRIQKIVDLFSDLIGIFLYFGYFAWFEASAWQATLGKRALGIKVTDMKGHRLEFWHAFGRNIGKIVSTLILYIGFMMTGWTHRKQALHDMMAGCLVIKKEK